MSKFSFRQSKHMAFKRRHMLWTSLEATKAIIATWVKSLILSKSVSLVCQNFITLTKWYSPSYVSFVRAPFIPT